MEDLQTLNSTNQPGMVTNNNQPTAATDLPRPPVVNNPGINTAINQPPKPNEAVMKQAWNEIDKKLKTFRARDKKVNISQFPDDYYDLIEKISIDLTRRRMAYVDLTTLISQEVVRFDFSNSVNLKEFLGFTGAFLENNLAGDRVPFLEQKTGSVGSVEMVGYALGHVRSLEDVLYNLDIYTIQKVNEAFTRAFIAKRNHLSIGALPAKTTATGWDAGQQVAADTTSGASKEELMYNTINSALVKLGGLYDFQAKQEIDMSDVVIVTGRNVDARAVNRAIRGQLNNSKSITSNREPLEVGEVYMYKGDSFKVGKETVSYPGVAASKAYMFVPARAGAPHYTLVKRPPTMVMSGGDALTLSQDKEAQYWIQNNYTDEFFGTSSGNAVITADTSHVWGYVIEITLPSA